MSETQDIFLRDAQRKIHRRRLVFEIHVIPLGKHTGTSAGGGFFMNLIQYSLEKRKGKSAVLNSRRARLAETQVID